MQSQLLKFLAKDTNWRTNNLMLQESRTTSRNLNDQSTHLGTGKALACHPVKSYQKIIRESDRKNLEKDEKLKPQAVHQNTDS